MKPELAVDVERWPIAGGFRIARGTKTEAEVVVVHVTAGAHVGHGECVPYARYGESVDGVREALLAQIDAVRAGMSRAELQRALPAGAARNALDAAFWSLEARSAGRRVHELAGLPAPRPVPTAFTISLAAPEVMAAAARQAASRPLLKIKLGAEGDDERIRAVRAAAPAATLIVDANEAWTAASLGPLVAACAAARVALIEQPLPAEADALLEGYDGPVPLCADESFHGREDLDEVARRYAFVNLKLDKTGGLTAAIEIAEAARARGLGLMVGCMVGTSLGMAPAFALTPLAHYVDLDGPLLLARDREPGFRYQGSTMLPAAPGVWD